MDKEPKGSHICSVCGKKLSKITSHSANEHEDGQSHSSRAHWICESPECSRKEDPWDRARRRFGLA